MSTFTERLAALKADLDAAGVPVEDVCEGAGFDRSTYTRWANGTIRGPRLENWEQFQTTACRLIAERKAMA